MKVPSIISAIIGLALLALLVWIVFKIRGLFQSIVTAPRDVVVAATGLPKESVTALKEGGKDGKGIGFFDSVGLLWALKGAGFRW